MDIEITYKHYVSSEIILSLEQEIKSLERNTSVIRDDEEWSNFTGSEVADVLISIKEHPIDFVVTGLVYDILKGSLVSLWKKLTKLKEAPENEKVKRHISVRMESKDGKKIVIELDKDISITEIDKVIDRAFEYLQEDKKEETFSNPDIVVDDEGILTVTLILNAETNVWEPYNIAEGKRKLDDMKKWMNDNLSS